MPQENSGTPGGMPRSDGPQASDWADTALAMARKLLGAKNAQNLRGAGDRAAKVVDVAFAAHLDELRALEKAEFQRARLDVGRELFIDKNSEATKEARARLAISAQSAGALRLQRDIARGTVKADGDGGDPDHQPDCEPDKDPHDKPKDKPDDKPEDKPKEAPKDKVEVVTPDPPRPPRPRTSQDQKKK